MQRGATVSGFGGYKRRMRRGDVAVVQVSGCSDEADRQIFCVVLANINGIHWDIRKVVGYEYRK